MLKSRRLLPVLALLVLTIMLPAMILNSIVTKAKASTTNISDSEVILEVGETKKLEVTGTTHWISWASNNRTVASVSYSGNITARKPGTVTITAIIGEERLTCKVTVIEPIQISNSTLALEIGEAKTLKITGTTSSVVWSSSNPSIASVSANGKVTAKSAGNALITALVDGKEKTSKVSVLQMLTSDITLEKGSTTILSVDGTSSKVTWTSSNSLVASVSNNGKVTAKSEGSTTITAYASGKRFSTVVTVTQSIRLNHSWTTLAKGDTLDLDMLGTNSKVTWTTSKPVVATVSEDGVVTAKTEGMTKITAAVDGIRFHIVITVKDKLYGEENKLPKASIQLNHSWTTLAKGDNLELDMLGTNSKVTWTTSKPGVATISENGVIAAKSEGMTRITAAVDGIRFHIVITVK